MNACVCIYVLVWCMFVCWVLVVVLVLLQDHITQAGLKFTKDKDDLEFLILLPLLLKC